MPVTLDRATAVATSRYLRSVRHLTVPDVVFDTDRLLCPWPCDAVVVMARDPDRDSDHIILEVTDHPQGCRFWATTLTRPSDPAALNAGGAYTHDLGTAIAVCRLWRDGVQPIPHDDDPPHLLL